jgi:serine/threonine protein kinase/Tol biopolymer transport system component
LSFQEYNPPQMALTPGIRLGPYEIVSALGAGGMGEVYRALDTRLERTVAIKILPVQFSSDPMRKQRFEREAKTISNLNHPHICVLHDIGHQDGIDYLVMECVEGETLAKRLEKGPLPLEQVLKLGAQIADALDKAHRSGVVHRDLKPGNIMLTPTGAKLLDFGLAKPAAPLASLATLTATKQESPVTEQGTIVGTFQYMSPEQIEGKELDGRSDIFSLGAVLYEMLTRQRAFPGKSQLSVASAILEKEPAPISSVKPLTPPTLDHAIRRCLAKEPERRWQSAADLAGELQWIGEAGNSGQQEASLGRLIRGSRLVWILTLALLGVTAFALWGWMRTGSLPVRPVTRWATVLPQSDIIRGVAFSPDGSHLAYIGAGQVLVRAMDQFEARQVSGDDRVSYAGAFFSPDGKWIAYRASGKLKKAPTAGGASMTICDWAAFPGAGPSGTWGPDDTIIFATGLPTGMGTGEHGLLRVPAAGGKPQVLTTPDPQKGETAHGWPHFLPGGKAVLFSIKTAKSWDDARIAVLNLRTGEQRVLLEGGSNPRYAPTGHLIYARGGSLFAVPFDPERLQLKSTPSPVLESISWNSFTGFADYSFSETGDLVYVPGGAEEQKTTMVWVDRAGKAEALGAPPRAYFNPSISPDGRRVAMSIGGGSADNWDIWIYDLARHTLTKLTYGSLNNAATWTPDGKQVAFRNRTESGQNGIFWAPADGSGPPEQLLAADGPVTSSSWLPDGRALLFYGITGEQQGICVLPIQRAPADSARTPQTVVKGGGLNPQVSPDGRWLAYQSAEQVFVQPFPGLGGKWLISTDGGNSPRWARNGRELFYRHGLKMMAVDIETKEGFRAGTPKVLFEGQYLGGPAGIQPGIGYDVSPDGKRFLMIKPEGELNAAQLQVVENWFDELRRRVATANK